MFFVSEIFKTPPNKFKTPLQEKTYQALDKLRIPFERVDTDEAITMEDCSMIDKKLNMKTIKTLFLCNRQQTAFYLFITAGDKPFKTKYFSKALGIPHVSFAPAELMKEILGTEIGGATVFSGVLESSEGVEIVFDKDILEEEWYGCSDGTTTGYMKIKTEDIVHKLIPYSKHLLKVIEV